MEGSQSNQNSSTFGAFSNGFSGAAMESDGDMEFPNESNGSHGTTARRSSHSQFATPDSAMFGVNQYYHGFSHGDEDSLAYYFHNLNLKNHTTDAPINHHNAANGHYYPSRPAGATLNQPLAALQDESMPLQFSDAHVKRNYSRGSGLHNSHSNFGIPYQPPIASVIPQQYYANERSQMYTPYDQHVGSDFIRHHDASSYHRVSNSHGLDSGGPYLNGTTFQKRNNWLNIASTENFPSSFYTTDGSLGSRDFRQYQQPKKVPHPYGLGSSQHRISRETNIKFYPSVNGCIDTKSSYQLQPHFLPSKYEFEPAIESPKTAYDSVDEVVGRICIVAKDQSGCRFLQKVFTEGTQEDAEKIFFETIDHIGELMVDPIAHHLVQNIIEECNDNQRTHIIGEVTKVPAELLKLSCNMHGACVVQKIVETMSTSDQVSKVVSALSPGAICLITDPNGNHVARCCLQKLLPEHKVFLLNAAASRHLQLARDRYGCYFLQNCIDHSSDDQRNILLSNITSSALTLSEDQYGNYVIQYILSLKIEWAAVKIVDELQGHFGNLSMQKCGSHVVEQCLKVAPQLLRDRVIGELMNDPKLPNIMQDQYGNYVIQTVLKECEGALHAAFVEAIQPHAHLLQNSMFGKRVLSRTYLKNRQYRSGHINHH